MVKIPVATSYADAAGLRRYSSERQVAKDQHAKSVTRGHDVALLSWGWQHVFATSCAHAAWSRTYSSAGN